MKPSVTNLIDMLDKPALVKWANKLGLDGVKIDDYKSKAKQDGSNIHEDIERYLKFKIDPQDDNLAERMHNFFKDKEVIDVEKTIETDYFIGRFDIKLRWRDIVFVCDWKSNSRVYFEGKLQLAAYKMAEPCDHVAVIHLPEFLIRPVDVTDMHSDFLILLSELYELRHKIENSK